MIGDTVSCRWLELQWDKWAAGELVDYLHRGIKQLEEIWTKTMHINLVHIWLWHWYWCIYGNGVRKCCRLLVGAFDDGAGGRKALLQLAGSRSLAWHTSSLLPQTTMHIKKWDSASWEVSLFGILMCYKCAPCSAIVASSCLHLSCHCQWFGGN